MTGLRQAFRALFRQPGFLLTAVVTLALGIGANTAVFSAIRTLLLSPLPFPEADRLVELHEITPAGVRQPVSLADFVDWRRQARSFDSLAAWRGRSFALQRTQPGAPPAVIQTVMTTAGFFDVLGIQPARGRAFTGEEARSEARLIVLTDRLWRREFGGRNMVGRTVRLNEEARTVVGILPPSFSFPATGDEPGAIIPLSYRDYGQARAARGLEAIARLRPGVDEASARAELTAIAARLASAYPDTNTGTGAGLRGLHETWTAANRRPLLLLAGAGLMLLLIACANVANLLLARFLARRREMAVRISLGAGSGRLTRQLLAEGLALSACGTIAGLLLASFCLELLPLALPVMGGASRVPELRLDSWAFGFAAVVSLAVGLVFGILPSLLMRRADPASFLKDGGAVGGSPSRTRLAGMLVIVQVALSMVLLAGAGLLLRSFHEVIATDPGFRTASVYRFGFGLPEVRYNTDARTAAFFERLTERLESIPGVESAGVVARLPMARPLSASFEPEGVSLPPRERPRTAINVASAGYFRALSIPLLEGRLFEARDRIHTPRVILVNQAFARVHFADRRAVGQRLRLSWSSESNPIGALWEVAGVVGDTRQATLEDPPGPTIYLPATQFPPDGGAFVLRVSRDEPGLAAAVRREVNAVDPGLEEITLPPLAEVIDRSLAGRRLGLALTGVFALVALLVTAVGIAGVVAYRAERRRQEMALRIALGATPGRVMRLVIGHGLALAATGAVLGWIAALAGLDVVQSQLYGISPTDPLTLLAVALLLGVVAVAASWLPARRATSAEPARLLRG